MLETLRRRLQEERDAGFTLIELMVVVLIIAILVAIAIPTFLGARERAQNRAAQSSARNALTAAKSLFTDTGNYGAANTPANMTAVEPSLTYVTTASTNETTVSVSGAGATFGGAVMSDTGTCFLIRDSAAAGGGTFFGTTATAANCTGAFAATAANTPNRSW